METFKNYILRPFIIILIWAISFSIFAETTDYSKWSSLLKTLHVVTLFIAFIVTGRKR